MHQQGIYKNPNSLNLIRLVAAVQVMLGHMIEHLQLSGNTSLLSMTYFFRGVPIFFVISGFLIWFSIERSPNYRAYLKKRFWRVYPELWMAVALSIITIIVFYHQWSVGSLSLFAFGQGTFFQFWTPSSLRGYGVGTPNGALWTIGVMIQFYIVVWIFHRYMKNRSLVIWIIGFFFSFGISWFGFYLAHDVIGVEIIWKLYNQTFIRYFWLFYIGMFIAEFEGILLPLLQRQWYILLAVAGVFFWTGWDLYSGYYLVWSSLLTAGLIGFAYRFPKLGVSPDISYGLFLYHMIVVNIFVQNGLIGKWVYVVPIVLLTAIIAYISTVTVGKWSASKKQVLKTNEAH